MKNHFVMLAQYNQWANGRVFSAAGTLSAAEYHAERGAFFGSIHRTLAHLLVADRIWLHRLTGEGPTHKRLDDVPFPDHAGLSIARGLEDTRIINCVNALDEPSLAESIRYQAITTPVEVVQVRATVLAHMFNHHAHHRGQAHALLTMARGRDFAPPIDLLLFEPSAR